MLERNMQAMQNNHHLGSSRFEEDDDFTLSDNESSSCMNDSLPHRTKSGRFSNVTDIAYLYSVPLVREENGKIHSMGLPIDHNAEIDDIVEGLEETHKMVNFRMETATIDALQNLFMIKPKVVHLSCHGDYDNKASTYYLAFEDKKVFGMMEKLSMNRLKKLFENQKTLKSIEAMVVSACHSQKIGELMIESGIPIVICINAPFKVQDEAARSFGKVFHTALVQGMSYKDAFSSAQNFVAAHKEANCIFSCCCAHPHKEDCQWTEKAKEIGHIKAHELHVPTCKCNLHGNLHYYASKRLCTFADEFLGEYATWDYYEDNEKYPDCTNLCCCSPEMPHDESMKFILLCEQKEYLDKKPFEKMEEGSVTIVSPLPTENEPVSVGNLSAVGRNLVLQHIVDSLSYTNSTETRLVHIYGVQGIGKTFVAKHAAKYLFERRNFDYGCIYIELKNKYAVGENLSSLICHTLGIATANKETLCKYIAKCKLLIILDKSSKVESLDPMMLNRTLEYFIDSTELPKFLVISTNKKDVKVSGMLQFEIEDLAPKDAARLLLLCAGQYIEEANKNLDELPSHEIFNLISYKPASIVRFCSFLKSYPNTLDEIVVQQKQQIQQLNQVANKNDLDFQGDDECSWVIKQSYEQILKTNPEEIMILFMLCQVPNGLFESDLTTICQEEFPKWKEFLTYLMKQKKLTQIDDLENKDKDASSEEGNEETSWLIA